MTRLKYEDWQAGETLDRPVQHYEKEIARLEGLLLAAKANLAKAIAEREDVIKYFTNGPGAKRRPDIAKRLDSLLPPKGETR